MQIPVIPCYSYSLIWLVAPLSLIFWLNLSRFRDPVLAIDPEESERLWGPCPPVTVNRCEMNNGRPSQIQKIIGSCRCASYPP